MIFNLCLNVTPPCPPEGGLKSTLDSLRFPMGFNPPLGGQGGEKRKGGTGAVNRENGFD
jgi:hypothetical protein